MLHPLPYTLYDSFSQCQLKLSTDRNHQGGAAEYRSSPTHKALEALAAVLHALPQAELIGFISPKL